MSNNQKNKPPMAQKENKYLAYLRLLEENLEIYHKQNNKTYRNKENIGWLKEYLEENGYYADLEEFEEDEEDEEDEWPKLQQYLKDYKANDFDEEQLEDGTAILYDIVDCEMDNSDSKKYFQWIKGNNRSKKIVEIFRKCSKNAYKKGGNFSTITDILDVDVDDFKVNDQDKMATKKLYQETCAKICNKDMLGDGSMITMLTISENKQMPFFQYIVDLYTRDTTKNGNETLPPGEWALKNEYIKKITNNYKSQKVLQIITSAISSFNTRVAPRLMTVGIDNKIDDSLPEIADYISSAVQFTHWLANGAGTGSQNGQAAPLHQTVPFQVDFAFTFGDIVADEKDDDEDDDFYDHFGDIGDKLEKSKVKRLSEVINNDEKKEDDLSTFDILKQHYNSWTRKETKEDINYKGYPRNHRFVCLIDRRKPKEDTAEFVTKEDEIHMFETPIVDDLPTNKLVPNAQPLVFFDLSQRSIIPGKDTKKMSQDISITDKVIKSTKTVKDACMSTLMVLSFHAMAVDEIKAYLYMNGQVLRFFNDDIKNIIPKYFVQNEKNKGFDASPFIELTKGKLIDTKFDKFYELYTNKE